jgi:hypothetical protein
MDWFSWSKEVLLGSGSVLLKSALIIFPLMVAIEFLKHYRLLEKISKPLAPFMRLIGLPAVAVYPIIAGITLGIIYGAGLIIQSAREDELNKKHLYLISLFLCICHSVFEDHMLLAAAGANGFLLVLVRLPLAFVITFIASKIMKDRSQPADLPRDTAVIQALAEHED